MCNTQKYWPGEVKVSKLTVSKDEKFDIYFKFRLDPATAQACQAVAANTIAFSPWLYKNACLPGDAAANVQSSYEATLSQDGYHALIKDVTLNSLGYSQSTLGTTTFCIYGYYHGRTESAENAYYITNGLGNFAAYERMTLDNSVPTHAETNPAFPSVNIQPAKLITTTGDGIVKDYSKVLINIKPNQNGAGLRSKYRIKWDDGDLNFGITGGLEGVHMEWANDESIMLNGVTQFTLPHKDNGYGFTNNPYFSNAGVYFNYAKSVQGLSGDRVACKGTSFGTDCSGIIFRESDGSSKGKGDGNPSLPSDLEPSLRRAAWQSSESGISAPTDAQRTNGNNGQSLGKVDFVALPAIIGVQSPSIWNGNWSIIQSLTMDNSVTLVAGSGQLRPFTVEVFANDNDIKLACQADPAITDKAKCDDLNFAKFGFASAISQSTSSSEQTAKTPTQTLYDFIIRIISSIVIFLTSVIYRIFAYFVVPVINALLQVRPYQDAFVNIIYPGWLILRNLANIFFIIALLVVGLRILFQQSAAGTARGFIMRLIIMALLVNFSLVIAQGVVGIADTVQSQFLPANTRVIEALGTKLMVEPITSFRTAIGGGDQNAEVQGDATIADVTKPIVLLMLAVAAFFAFLAIAAFLAVRLVVLMILYMVSPVAYVGFVMDETKGYAKRWWDEFIKYAFLTPVLVFFLNIAALIATVTSSNTGNVINIGDGLSEDLVAGGLTIISHFIVLLVIFAGMKVALSSGTIGAKTITDYAKKGFTGTMKAFKKPVDWAGAGAKGAAQTQWDRRFKGGMLDPFAHRDAFKKSVADKTKKVQDARLASKEGKLTPGGLYKDPWKAIKYMARGGSLNSALLENDANKRAEHASILTEKERQEKERNLGRNIFDRDVVQAESDALNNGQLTMKTAEDIIDSFDKAESDLITERDAKFEKLNKQIKQHEKKDEDAQKAEKEAELKILQDEYNERLEGENGIITQRKNFQNRIDAAVSAGKSFVKLDAETQDNIKVVFDVEKEKDKLKEKIRDLNKEINSIGEDDKLRQKYGYKNGEYMTLDKRAEIQAEEREIRSHLHNHHMPVSMGARDARLSREKEAEKLITEMEGEELQDAFKKAMNDNNADLASAIAKKIAKEGDFDTLLKEHGYKNNVEEFQKFIDKKFAKFTPTVRYQIGSEISSLNEKNGNLALGKAYKVEDGKLTARPMAEQLRKINAASEGKSADDVLKKKKWDLSYETESGHMINEGDIKNLNRFDASKLKNLEKMNWKKAKHIADAENFDLLHKHIREKIKDIAEGRN